MYMKRLLAMLLCVAMLSTLLVGGVSAANEDVYIEDSTIVIEDGKVVSGDTSLIDSGVIVIGDDDTEDKSALSDTDGVAEEETNGEEADSVTSETETESARQPSKDNPALESNNWGTEETQSGVSTPDLTPKYIRPDPTTFATANRSYGEWLNFDTGEWYPSLYELMVMHWARKVTGTITVDIAHMARGYCLDSSQAPGGADSTNWVAAYAGPFFKIEDGGNLTVENTSGKRGGVVVLDGLRVGYAIYDIYESGSNSSTAAFTKTYINSWGNWSYSNWEAASPLWFDPIIVQNGGVSTFKDTNFRNGLADENGAGMQVNGGTFNMSNGSFRHCRAKTNGGGLYVTGSGTAKLNTVTFDNCTAGSKGGAIYVNGGTLELTGCTINNCSALEGGAIYVSGSATVTITNTAISQNTTKGKDGSGGAMYIAGGEVTVKGTSKINNNTAYNNGGAIRVAGGKLTVSGTTEIKNNSFNQATEPEVKNYALGSNGGMFKGLNDVVDTSDGSQFTNNYLGDTSFSTFHKGKLNNGTKDFTNGDSIAFRYGNSAGNAYIVFKLSSKIIINSVKVYVWDSSAVWGAFPENVNVYVSNTDGTTGTQLSGGTYTGSAERIYSYFGHSSEWQYVIIRFNIKSGGWYVCCSEVEINGYVEPEAYATNTYGGGIYNEGETTISGGTISSNTATNGGGIYSKGTLTTTGGTISTHTSITNGAGVYIGGGSASFGATTINNNQANFGGGLYVNSASTITFDGTTLRLNKADNQASSSRDGNGGAMWIGSGADVTVKGNTLMEQNVAYNNGGAIAIARGCTVNMEKGTLRGNIADKGGAVSCYSADNSGNPVFNLKGGTISGNYATTYGGGVCIRNGNGHEFSGGTISGNYAQRGAGVYVGISERTGVYNGGLTLSGNVLIQSNGSESDQNSGTVLGSSYIAEATVEGGGIYIESDQPLNMNGGTVDNNVSITNGGGIYAKSSTVSIGGGTISNNKAYCDSNGGGGGIYATQSTLTIGASGTAGPSMTGNGGNRGSLGTAAFDGGAIYCINTPLTIHSCTISQNRSCHAAVYLVNTSPCTMNGGKISENSDGGVFLNGTGADFTMNGGEISGNILGGTGESHGQQNYGGAGICSYNGADVTITGGKISDNHNNKDGATTTEEYDTKSCGGGIAMIRKTTSNTVGPLTITGGEISGNTANIGYGGGIYIEEGGTLNINKAQDATITISGNTADTGGGIYMKGATGSDTTKLHINGATISGNTAATTKTSTFEDYGHGGGIYVYKCVGIESETVTITNSVIDGNHANTSEGDGGGIFSKYTDIALSNSTVSNNTANLPTVAGKKNGGGINFENSTLTVNDCKFNGNKSSGWAGGLYVANSATATISNSSFDGNEALSEGGGLAMYQNATATVENTYFGNNKAYSNISTHGSGGAISLSGNTTDASCVLTLKNSYLGYLLDGSNQLVEAPNQAKVKGGGIYVKTRCEVDFVGDVSVCNNEAGSNGGGMCFDSGSTVSFADCNALTVNNNEADVSGGGIYTETSLTASHVTVKENNAIQNGGGIYVRNTNLTLTDADVSDNEAGAHSGGIGFYSNGYELKLTDCTVSNNDAEEAGGIFIYDGATGTISGTIISGNTASDGDGGGILVAYNSNATLTDCYITRNTASGNYSGETVYHVDEVDSVGTGGGVAVFDNSSFTFNVENGGAIYGNNASTAGDDVFANGFGTSLELPAAADMDTAVSRIENGIWCEDYMDGDSQYAQGLNGGNGYNYGRYDSAAAAIRAYASSAEGAASNYINDANRYVAITFDIPKYSVGSIKITAPDVSDTNQMFAFVINGTTIKGEQVTVNVSVKAGQTVEVSQLFAGNYTVIMDADWSWRYTVNGITVDGEDNDLGEVSIEIVGRTVDEVHTVDYTAEANKSKWLTHNSNNVTNTASVPAQVVHHFDMAAYDKRQLV
ncbi:MAG: right-handed parallel beta-helix repeat-containing protein [Clostridia bacterium]|nr:right-handed parallel beta-helix repeat-containing protein [Clostridia bacterium]